MIPAGAMLALRVALVLVYLLLAHLAGTRHDGVLAAWAMADLMLIVLMEPLLRLQPVAWVVLAAGLPVLWWLAGSAHALMPLLLVPVAFLGMVGWLFGRTLRAGRVPLITRIVVEMEQAPVATQSPDLRCYTRRLTAAWALLLAALAAINLLLALCAVPSGLLAGFGIPPPLSVTETQWSWVANVLNYGLVGGFFLAEFFYRERHFPGRYRSFWDFASKLARLGPAFWREVVR